MDPTVPTETFEDGTAAWETDPFEVSATPARPGLASEPAVTLDGRSLSPRSARALARVLLAAADHADQRASTTR